MRKCIIIGFAVLSVIQNAYSQSRTIKKDSTHSPYELISSYYNSQFKPFKKRNIYVGFAMSLEDRKLENTDLLVRKVLDGNRNRYDLNFRGGYFIGNYVMVGLGVNYNQDKFTGLVLRDSDTISSRSLARGFAFMPFIRSSVPLTANERLSFYTGFGITYGRTTSLTSDVSGLDVIDKTYVINNRFGVSLSPGVIFFAMENFALEVELNVLGYELNTEKRRINYEDYSSKTRQNVDFEINILSLQLGLTYYFGAGK